MEMILPIILYSLDIIEYYIGNKYFFEGRMRRFWLVPIAGIALLILLSVLAPIGSGTNIFVYFFTVLVVGIMIEEGVKIKVIRMTTLFCIAICLDGIADIIWNKIIIETQMTDIINSLTMIILTIAGAYGFKKLKMRRSAQKHIFQMVYVILILLCLSLAFIIGGVQFIVESLAQEVEIINVDFITLAAFGFVGLLVVLILYVQSLYRLLEKLAETERDLKQLQATYYQGLLDKEEETRRYRHDMHNHLLYIGELAKSEKTGQIAEYVKSLEEKWNKISKKHYETGNMTLNILLNHYLADLEGVKISVVGVLKRELAIEEVDLCTIFSNLIQNAVEELKRQEGDKRFFSLEIRQGRENTSITIRNSAEIWVNRNEALKTDKEDKRNHGIGLKNVEEMVKHYSGEFSWEANGEEFKAAVLMKG